MEMQQPSHLGTCHCRACPQNFKLKLIASSCTNLKFQANYLTQFKQIMVAALDTYAAEHKLKLPAT
jgi:hypothetical protein